jgi:hypothetical protein
VDLKDIQSTIKQQHALGPQPLLAATKKKAQEILTGHSPNVNTIPTVAYHQTHMIHKKPQAKDWRSNEPPLEQPHKKQKQQQQQAVGTTEPVLLVVE